MRSTWGGIGGGAGAVGPSPAPLQLQPGCLGALSGLQLAYLKARVGRSKPTSPWSLPDLTSPKATPPRFPEACAVTLHLSIIPSGPSSYSEEPQLDSAALIHCGPSWCCFQHFTGWEQRSATQEVTESLPQAAKPGPALPPGPHSSCFLP